MQVEGVGGGEGAAEVQADGMQNQVHWCCPFESHISRKVTNNIMLLHRWQKGVRIEDDKWQWMMVKCASMKRFSQSHIVLLLLQYHQNLLLSHEIYHCCPLCH